MDIINFLLSISNAAYLQASDGQLLGLLSNNPNDLNSISNLNGQYGSFYGLYSIRNSSGMYGGQGLYSPFNLHCLNPPVVIYQNQVVLVVTKNRYAQTNGLPVVDPELMLGVYASF